MNTATKSAKFRRVLATALFAAFVSGAAVCSAADGDPLQSTVKYGDLKVSSTQGANTLYGRIRSAAQGVCHSLDGRDMASKKLFAACVHDAIAKAVNKVDQPSLFAVYNAKSGASKPIVLASSQTR